MRPILFKVPALPLLIACLLVAVIAIVRDVVPWKGKKSTFPMTSVWALGGAAALLRLIGKLGIDGADVMANLRVGFVPIYAYGVMLGTSLVVGWFIAMHLAKQDGIDQQEAGSLYMWGGGLVDHRVAPALVLHDAVGNDRRHPAHQSGRPGRLRRDDWRDLGHLVLLPQARHPASPVGGRGGAVGRSWNGDYPRRVFSVRLRLWQAV